MQLDHPSEPLPALPGFVVKARLCAESTTIEVDVRPRLNSRICSVCQQPGPTYDHLAQRCFRIRPLLGLYGPATLPHAPDRLPDLRRQGRAGAVGEWQASTDDNLYAVSRPLGGKLSWKDTAQSFHTSWEKVCQAVEYVVAWGLEYRTLGPDSGDRRR